MGEIVAASFMGSMSRKTILLSLRWVGVEGGPGGYSVSEMASFCISSGPQLRQLSGLRNFESGSCFSETVNKKKKKIISKKFN